MEELATHAAFRTLVREVVGEYPTAVGGSFNLHFKTPHSFIKVTRPWVKPARFETEVSTASYLSAQGLPVAAPLTRAPLSFEDSEGRERWVSFWELLRPRRTLRPEEATALAAEWIRTLWLLTPTPTASTFSLSDFLHAVQVRLAPLSSPLAERILASVEPIEETYNALPPQPFGFIHGDLHNENLMLTNSGLRIIDWESSCKGPLEWDVAQNLRYTPPGQRAAQEAYWRVSGLVEPEVVSFFRHVRSLSSLSHLVATGLKPPIYYRCLEDLGWT